MLPLKTDGDEITYWWLILLAGIVLLIMGVWIIAEPAANYLSLYTLFAFGMIVTGGFEVVFAINNYKLYTGWLWTMISGVLDILLGIYLATTPDISMALLPVIAGVWMLFKGFTAIKNALDMRSDGFADWNWILLVGIVITIMSLIIISDPAFDSFNIILWTGFASIFTGLFRVSIAIKIRKYKNEVK
jgi:hypothetical protein